MTNPREWCAYSFGTVHPGLSGCAFCSRAARWQSRSYSNRYCWQEPVDSGDRADVSVLEGKKQAFLLTVLPDGKLLVAGSDQYGTAYGIMELSRSMGVSPWEWWADVTPERKDRFELPAGYKTIQAPSVEYRGIFINDEDWGLMPWSSLNYERGISPDALARVPMNVF